MNESITTRFHKIYDEVDKLANNRISDNKKVNIIVVTKKQKLEACLEVIEAGASILGENYADEAVKKFSEIDVAGIRLHMIGHLQSRKVKLLYPLFANVQTIDGMEISQKIDKLFIEKGQIIDALLEVNFTDEDSKSGYKIRNQKETEIFYKDFESIKNLQGVNVCGLMTMGYFPQNPEINRKIFSKTKQLLENIQNKYQQPSFQELSMGTSGDYKTAIEEGATMVRIGEKIMGSRMVEVN